jgi:hypothetical protein
MRGAAFLRDRDARTAVQRGRPFRDKADPHKLI